MKLVIAYLQPFMAEKVVEALHEVSGLSGATISAARGFGRGRAGGLLPGITEEDLVGTQPRQRLELVVSEDSLEQVLATIQQAAHTGQRGDGKVYILEVVDALRIRTGERGAAAV
jgi:nitrogen regulatory protein P-II 1